MHHSDKCKINTEFAKILSTLLLRFRIHECGVCYSVKFSMFLKLTEPSQGYKTGRHQGRMQIESPIFGRDAQRRIVQRLLLMFRSGGYCCRNRGGRTGGSGDVLLVFVGEHANGQQLTRGLWWPREPAGIVTAPVGHGPVNGGARDGQQQSRTRRYQHDVFKCSPTSQGSLRIAGAGIVRVGSASCAAADATSVTGSVNRTNRHNMLIIVRFNLVNYIQIKKKRFRSS